MRIPNGGFVVVTDGGRMLFLRNSGDAEYPNLEVERVRENDNPPDREQGSDKAGTSHASVGASRSSMEETDFHQLQEDRFAAETADRLRTRALNGDFESLIIVAPPKTLGELRKHYHKEVENRLLGEIGKDLTGHPVDEIEKIIMAA